jgi:predicted RNA methylase
MSYHDNLTSDYERLAGFYESITKKSEGIIFDIGTGSGILSTWAAPNANFIYAVEKDSIVAEKTRSYLNGFKNISFIEGDARKIRFPEKADLIICEMLDTALIDEEQVPVLNSVLKYLKRNGTVIPQGVINIAEPVYMEAEHLFYEETENPNYHTLGSLIVYSKYDFKKPINPKADFDLQFKISRNGILNGVKITTFTLITSNIICGPTPMLNPPLLIPIHELRVKKHDTITINLKYTMGGGLDTIRNEIKEIS